MSRWPIVRWPHVRDGILFVGGLAGTAHETLIAKADRPTLLLLFAGMMGVPVMLRKDAKPPDPPTPPPPPSVSDPP